MGLEKIEKDTWLNKKLIEKAKKDKVKLVFDRFEEQQPQCPFGMGDVCCKICHQGPCRIIPGRQERGICGATADTIVARNFLCHASAGAACHTDHAKENILTLLEIAENKTKAYKITDEAKLRNFAKRLGKKSNGPINEVAKEVALEALEDYRRQQGLFTKSEGEYLNWLRVFALPKRIHVWKKLGILPLNADAEISHALHQTAMGCDADPVDLWLSVLRIGLVDGYAGLRMATDIQDIIFGTPSPIKSEANLGVLKKDYVNIAVHGHVPLLSEKIVQWANKLNNTAKKVGAKGINVVGICCTGHEVLMRHGIPLAGHVMQQEMAITTGVLDLMVVDTQCIYPSITEVASCFHTKIVTTIDYVKIPGAIHIPFKIETADKSAKKIIETGVENFKNRRSKESIYIPDEKITIWGGFSAEAIIEALSKLNKKDPLKPLIDNIANGNILGVAAVVGCRNPKLKGQKFGEKLMRILIKNNILVVVTGCMAHAAAQDGLMIPDAVKFAGSKLRKVLEVIGKANGLTALPPVLHMGSCVDNSRIGTVLNAIASKLNIDIAQLPVAASAPEYATEKAVAIGSWALAEGIGTHFNPVPPVTGSKIAVDILTKKLSDITGGTVLLGTTPEKAAEVMIAHIKKKRKELGLK